ncbi:MAG: class I SAM-dependent methyltransferase [Geminicoccaceae bacterium]
MDKHETSAPDATSQPAASWLTARMLDVAGRISQGTLILRLPDGDQYRVDGEADGPLGELHIHDLRMFRRFLIGGGVGFAESYMDGDWDSPDLAALLGLFALNEQVFKDRMAGTFWFALFNRLQHWRNRNTKSGAQRNIHAHYDLGNRFYSAWLDTSMTYSSGLFSEGANDLEGAQRAKYASLARHIEVGPDQDVLEIGCGWGGFAEFVAGEIGARVTGITISKEQYAYAAERIQKAGLNDRVELRLQDYRDVEHGRFDRIASIEMFEAVGREYWPTYFTKVRDALKPGGVAGLQIITIADQYFDNYRRSVDFIQRYVFPGGMLPSPQALSEQFRQAGLVKRAERAFGPCYAETLAVWNRRFQQVWPELRGQGFDTRFKRLWDYYLAYCEAGFRAGCTDVVQVAVARS